MAQIGLLLGCFWVVRNIKKISAEYLSFVVSSLIILAVCVLLPRFSNIINATRFYHIALFSLSPLMVMGLLYILRNVKLLAIIFIVPYVLFMTGAMFELIGETNTGTIVAPYSIALSNYRLEVVGEYSADDKKVADWVTDSGIEPVLTDVNGMLLLSQRKEPFEFIHRSPYQNRYYTVYPLNEGGDDLGQAPNELYKGWGYLPQDVTELPEGTYIFLTDTSMQTKTVTFKPQWYNMGDSTTGMRVNYSFEFIKLENYEIVYQSGDAAVLRLRSK